MTLKTGLIVPVCLLVIASAAVGKIIYVDADAAGANNGSSWLDAYNFLQDALADANSSEKPLEIQVAQGVYKPDSNSAVPDGTKDREAAFQLINGVTLKGGYAGSGEPDPNAHDIELYETILSGDLHGNDVDMTDPCNLRDEPSRAENSYHVVSGSRTGATAVFDGFTVTGGNANGSKPLDTGGGMYIYGSPIVSNCTFKQNSAYKGGAIGCAHSARPKVMTTLIISNMGTTGGGVYMYYNSGLSLSDCTIVANFAQKKGGGVYSDLSYPKMDNCAITANRANERGGGIYSSCDTGSARWTNCLINGNSSYGDGGGIYCYWYSHPRISNCTVTGNSARDYGGGIYFRHDSSPQISKCIFWDNDANEGHQISSPNLTAHDASRLSIQYTNLEGGLAGIYIDPYHVVDWGFGNIEVDPCFAQPGYLADANDPNIAVESDNPSAIWVNGDYHLKSQAGRWDANEGRWAMDEVTSPCIDAGNPMFPIGDEPFPNGGIINMGAYGGTAKASKSYFGLPVCETIVAGDVNGDCVVDFKDFEFLALHWLTDNSP